MRRPYASNNGLTPNIEHVRSATLTNVCEHGEHPPPQHVGHWLIGIENNGRTQSW
ncbi:MAG TPA: hypothetical protein VK629_15195 [Steroidobacteraceae bacterium]|nr:hypothetical protein [Steroidobacteraceae bacterium]